MRAIGLLAMMVMAKVVIGGDGFIPMFQSYKWAAEPESCPVELGIFKDCALMLRESVNGFPGGRGMVGLNEYMTANPYRGTWVKRIPEEYQWKKSYAVDDFGLELKKIKDKGRPIVLNLTHDCRPAFMLRDNGYPNADRKRYAEFKKEYPNFLGFKAMGEFDSDMIYYGYFIDPELGKKADPQLREHFLKKFPLKQDGRWDAAAWARLCYENEVDFHFGETKLCPMVSGICSMIPMIAALGDGDFSYEATAQSHASWQVAAAFCRGAMRQFGKDLVWYTANYYNSRTPEGKGYSGESRWCDFHPYKSERTQPYMGAGRSLINRQNAYGWLIGAKYIQPENWHMNYAREENGKFVPSEIAWDFEKLYQLSKKTERGTPYIPMALLVPTDELMWTNGWGDQMKDKFTEAAFFHTLVPINCDSRWDAPIKRKGISGCLYNSEFGEICDALAPDAIGSKVPLAKALKNYKVAILCGTAFEGDKLDRKAIEEFVNNGGTLLVSADQVALGLISSDLAGVEAEGKSTGCYKGTVKNLQGDWSFELTEEYEISTMKKLTAQEYLVGEDGKIVVAFENRVGAGKVITFACESMLPAKYRAANRAALEKNYEKEFCEISSCRQKFSLIAAVYRKVQQEYMPVKVSGGCQWGINRTSGGWLFWAFNNDGVTKWVFRPEEIDLTKTIQCKAEFKNGKEVSVELPPGEWKIVEVKD